MTEMLTNELAARPFNPKGTPHAAEASTVAQSFEVSAEQGLSSSEVTRRRARFGSNELQSVQPRSRWRMLLDQFNNLVVGLLGFAALVAWLSGERIEAVAILIVLALNALIGFITAGAHCAGDRR